MLAAQLAIATGASLPRADNWLEPITTAMALFHIDTPGRQAAFLAQIGHESGGLRWPTEVWGPTAEQLRYDPPGQKARDLGNTRPGDGYRYRGHGLIQITGHANHVAARDGIRLVVPGAPDFELFPNMLAAPRWAAMSAAWFWSMRGLNPLADVGSVENFETITRRINGGLNGFAERMRLWDSAKKALGVNS